MRAVRIARSVGRPSRLKKPPGIFPAAYIRSSTSTVSGKKSAPSRASIRPCAVASTIVSPARTTTEPSACLASLPDSNVSSWSPTVTDTVAVRGSVVVAMWVSSTFRGEWRFESASTGSTLAQTSTLRLGLGSLVGLPPQAELLNEGAIALEVALLQVLQEPPAAADELEQAAARVVVLRVRPQVLGQLVDASRQQRDLHFRRAGVALGVAVLADDLQLRFLGQSQFFLLLQRLRNPSPPRGSSRERPRLRSCARVASRTGIPGEPRPLLTAVRMQSMRAAIAAGHPATVEAGIEILAEGGSAADAAVAACLASCVAETVMTGLLGGGHAIYFEASSGRARNLDCFVAVPGIGPEQRHEAELFELEVPFGTELVHYAVGIASCGVPGLPAGLAALHEEHGRLPWARLAEPALRLARDGVDFPPAHAACLEMLAAVMTMNEGARIYSPGGELLRAGERLEQPGLAEALEIVATEGPRSFYDGSLADALLALMDERGGLVTRADLVTYEARWSDPVEVGYADTRCLTRSGLSRVPQTLPLLPALLGLSPPERAVALAHTLETRGTESHTTNITTVDVDGNACVLTTSLGLGSGDFLPGLDLHLNSMLGESDLIRERLDAGDRMESMLAPTLVLDGEGLSLAAGSAGGTRLRTALLGVAAGILDEGLDADAAVQRPRFHPAPDVINAEPGVDEPALEALEARGYSVRRWPAQHHYFGGVSVVSRNGAAGDPRRNGAASRPR